MTVTVAREVSASALRDKMTSTVSTVTYGHERVGITRHGKLVAVMVPVEDVELLEKYEELADIRAYDEAKASDDGSRVSADEFFAELG
ncbi:type II toxin-antitoxin system Phd/YefM family antitoxin [Microbacterium soli]|uniref:Antitoxin n=1 Tax=Microbacterium soli TaxID=446075 RepID=A0ABP7NFQ5_9MICO